MNPRDHTCTNVNTHGSFTCSCNNGYELDDNGRSCNGMYIMLIITNCLLLYILCIDIDECLSGPCPSHMIHNNNDGSYSCDCPDSTIEDGLACNGNKYTNIANKLLLKIFIVYSK